MFRRTTSNPTPTPTRINPDGTQQDRIQRRPLVLSAALTLALLSGGAWAQNALGDGTALDASTGQSGRRNYQRPNFADELSFRNAIATGNAPGGLSFRGDLGYRAPGEFRGELGSDSLFAFRRDSLYSGLAGMGIRGTDALQYQFSLTTGASTPRNLMGNLSLSRDSYYNPNSNSSSNYSPSYANTGAQHNAPGSDITISYGDDLSDPRGQQFAVPANPADIASNTDPILGSLRSSSTYSTTSNLQPALLSVYAQGIDRQQFGLIASPLLGITSTPMAQDKPKAANPLVTRPNNADTDPTTPGGFPSTRVISAYDEQVDQMRQRMETMRAKNDPAAPGGATKDPQSSNDWFTDQMKELREKIYGVQPANDGDPNASDPGKFPADPNNPGAGDPASQNQSPTKKDEQGDPQSRRNPSDPNGKNPISSRNKDDLSPVDQAIKDAMRGVSPERQQVELYDPTQIAIDPDTLEVLRGSAATEIDQLLDPGAQGRNVYAEHINAGERLLQSGRYFDAEERFTHALSLKPQDVPAQLGRFHAQIGAGMVLSASVNLQSLFSQYPEIIASRYTGKLLPAPARIETLIERLKERAGITQPELSTRIPESDRVRVAAGMLLAYIGYQVDDQDAITSGLRTVKERGSDADRRFASLLAQVWTGRDIAVPQSDGQSSGESDKP